MNVFLGGGGSGEDSVLLDNKFVATLYLSKPLLYIPIAMEETKHSYESCLVWLKGVLRPYKVTNIVMWTEADLKNKTEADFDQFTGVYIGGGNTFKLLKELKKFGTFDILKKLALKNVPLYGGSAGAVLFAKTIIPAGSADPNTVGLTDFSAINLLDGYDMWCHYTPSNDPTINEYMEKYRLEKILAIPEASGVHVTENGIEVVGPASITVFREGTVIAIPPGHKI